MYLNSWTTLPSELTLFRKLLLILCECVWILHRFIHIHNVTWTFALIFYFPPRLKRVNQGSRMTDILSFDQDSLNSYSKSFFSHVSFFWKWPVGERLQVYQSKLIQHSAWYTKSNIMNCLFNFDSKRFIYQNEFGKNLNELSPIAPWIFNCVTMNHKKSTRRIVSNLFVTSIKMQETFLFWYLLFQKNRSLF